MLPAIPEVTLISWNGSVRYLFPERSRKQHVSFRKLKNMTRVVVIKKIEAVGFLSGLRLCRWKIPFTMRPYSAGFSKACLLAVLELYKKTHQRGTVDDSMRRKCQGRVFCELWLPYLLFPWLRETVLSDHCQARCRLGLFYFQNCDLAVVVMQRRKHDVFWQV